MMHMEPISIENADLQKIRQQIEFESGLAVSETYLAQFKTQ